MKPKKPPGPFWVYLHGRNGFTFEGRVSLLTGARLHARSLLRLPYNKERHAVIENRSGYRETMTFKEANK